jgi:hypothetical protein
MGSSINLCAFKHHWHHDQHRLNNQVTVRGIFCHTKTYGVRYYACCRCLAKRDAWFLRWRDNIASPFSASFWMLRRIRAEEIKQIALGKRQRAAMEHLGQDTFDRDDNVDLGPHWHPSHTIR